MSLLAIFPSNEFKRGTQYNLSGKMSRLNNILEVEKYLIKKQQQTKSLVKGILHKLAIVSIGLGNPNS